MKSTLKHAVILTAIVVLLSAIFLCPAGLAEGDLTFEPNVEYDNGVYKVKTAETYEVSGTSGMPTPTTDRIEVTASDVMLVLLEIDVQPTGDPAIKSSNDLSLETEGVNTLRGINCFDKSVGSKNLTISGEGVLNVLSYPADEPMWSIAAYDLTIDGGTFVIDGMLTDDNIRGSLIINGGSVKASIFEPIQPKNAAGEPVFLTCIQLKRNGGIVRGARIGSEPPIENGYKFEGAQTDDSGKYYFYLPNESEITSIKLENGDVYQGTAVTGEHGTDPQDPAVFTYVDPYVPEPDPPYSVSGTGSYQNGDNGLNITSAGDYTVSVNYASVAVPITVTAPTGEVNITLHGVNTSIPEASETPALNIAPSCGANVKLILGKGTNSILRGGANCAGIQKSGAQTLTITGEGSLEAYGGVNGAGIGSGKGADVSNIIFESGTVTAEGGTGAADIGGGDAGRATAITVLGGSIKGKIPEGCQSVPLEITLDGESGAVNIESVKISNLGAGFVNPYGVKGVRTIAGKLYFWLPTAAIVESATAGGKEYTLDGEYTVPEEGGSVTLYPPQYEAYVTGAQTPIANTYRDGLVVTGNAKIALAKGVKTAKAPIYIAPSTNEDVEVTVESLNVDTTERITEDCLVFAPDGAGATKAIISGENYFSSIALREAEKYGISFKFSDDKSSLKMGKMVVKTTVSIPLLKLFGGAKSVKKEVLMNLPGVTLNAGSQNGEGVYSIVKHEKNDYDMALSNAELTLDGLIPAYVDMTIDADSTLFLKKDSLFTLLGDSTISGAGKILTEGVFIGDVDVNLRYKIDASAMFGHKVVVTGVENGYADQGAEVTVSVVETEDFLYWEFTPELPDEPIIDLTQKTVAFKADKSYTIKAIYRTPVTGVAFDKKSAEVALGEVYGLKWTLAPEDATDRTVSFSSDDENVAQVSESGEVYGLSTGKCNITVTTREGGFKDVCLLTVTEGPITPLDVGVAAIKVSSSMKLEPPSGYEGDWSTRDRDIAVIVDNKKLKALKTGETALTFTVRNVTSKKPSLVNGKALSAGESATIPLMVRKKKELVSSIAFGYKKLYLAPGEEYKLSPTLKPKSAKDLDVFYKIGDLKVARLSGDSLIAMNKGTTALTATSASFVTKKLTVIVTDELQKLAPVKKKLTVKTGEKANCLVITTPLGLANPPISWTSKDEKIAVVDTATGEVTGVKKGVTTITAKAGTVKAKFTVTVK